MGATIDRDRAVILGGGEILDYQKVAARITGAEYIICADSGLDHCQALGVAPQLLVGDFDSVQSPLPPHVPRVPFPGEKNYTDTTHAIIQALDRGYRKLLLAGMLGGRLDHTLANLQSLANLSGRGVEACMTDGLTDVFAITDGEITLEPREHCYFSLLCYSQKATGVFIRGAKYPLTNHTLYFDVPRGISNEFLSGPATISVASGTLLILCVPMDRGQ